MSFPIGEAARRAGVKVPTIRFYEQAGLMPKPPRGESNRRFFDEAAVDRLRFIRHARDLGFEMDDIRALLSLSGDPEAPCAGAHAIAHEHLARIETKIAQLTALKHELERINAHADSGRAGACEVIAALADHCRCEHHHKA